jgi:hypothetical protein
MHFSSLPCPFIFLDLFTLIVYYKLVYPALQDKIL